VFEGDDSQSLVFGIPVDSEYRDIVREAWRDLRVWIHYGPKDLLPADRARTELVQFLADHLRRRGVPRPIHEAWKIVGTPDPKEFASKTQPGQPLGDLRAGVVLDQFAPLVRSRLRHFRVAHDEDAKSAAQLGLLNALSKYDPAEDVSVGLFAKAHRLIDDEIKRTIRGKASDAWYQPQVSGDENPLNEESESSGDRWDTIPKLVMPDEVVYAMTHHARDKCGRIQPSRIPFWLGLWIEETGTRSDRARAENWVSLPATPQEMAHFAAALSSERLASGMLSLSKPERDIVTARFFSNPPILLDSIARDKKLSYRGALTTAYRALHKIADGLRIKARIKTQRPIWPMRDPPTPRQLEWRPPGPPDFQYRRILEEIRQWPLLDGCSQTVHNTRVALESNPEKFFDREESDLVLNDIY
jgi:hypothetical protein